MTVKVLEFKREDWRDAAKTLRKIADDLDAGEHPECTVGALTLIGARGEGRGDRIRPRPQVR
jgi:hypothetical protein